MTNFQIDNSADSDLKKVILWQYDKAEKLIAIIQMFKDFVNQSTKSIWDKLGDGVGIASFNGTTETIPETVDDFTLALLGKILGINRPYLTWGTGASATKQMMSSELYRKIIIARWRIANTNASLDAYLTFVKYIFGSNVKVECGTDMSLSFVWTNDETLTTSEQEMKYAIEQSGDMIFAYPSGVKSCDESTSPVFGLLGQATMTESGSVISPQTMSGCWAKIENTDEIVVNSITASTLITNSSSSAITIPIGSYIKDSDGNTYSNSLMAIYVPAGMSTYGNFTKSGDGTIEAGDTSSVYNSSGTVVSSSLSASVIGITKSETQPSSITVPAGSYITVDSINYIVATKSDVVIEPYESVEILLLAASSTTPSFSTATLYDDDGVAIDNSSTTFLSSVQYSGYPVDAEQNVKTYIVVSANLSASAAIIPQGAKTTIDSVTYTLASQKTLTADDNTFTLVALGESYVAPHTVTTVTASDGTAIAGVSSYDNASRSITDFHVDTMDNASLSWNRK